LGGLIAALGGLDALIFTGGVGENSPVVRQAICDRLMWLGVELDHLENEKNRLRISSSASGVEVYVIPTNEEKTIAIECDRLVTKLQQ
jgi:acetate kinase